MEPLLMDLDTKVTAVQHSPLHKLCKCQLPDLFIVFDSAVV